MKFNLLLLTSLLSLATLSHAMDHPGAQGMKTPSPAFDAAPPALPITPIRYQRDVNGEVRRLTDEERETYRVSIQNGNFYTVAEGRLSGQYLYFLSIHGALYMINIYNVSSADEDAPKIYHSSFDRLRDPDDRASGECSMAGEMLVRPHDNPALAGVRINNDSGHYKPAGGLAEIDPVRTYVQNLGFTGTVITTLENW